MKTDVFEPTAAGVIVDLWGLAPVLAATYAVVLGAVALATGWQLFIARKPHRHRHRAVVPRVGSIERDRVGAR